jgi:Putative zinc-finger
MEHRVAEQTNAVERYLLNEFSPQERMDFEAHLFDCPICGELVRQDAIAIENVKQVFREEGEQFSEASRRSGRSQGWTSWFRMPVLVPSLAALAFAVVVIYQNGVLIPGLEQPQVLSENVVASQSRESVPVVRRDPRLAKFNVIFEVDAPKAYASYVCEFQRQKGATILKLDSGPQDKAEFLLDVLLPAKRFPPGSYTMILHPSAEPRTEVRQYSFIIQDRGP